MKKMIVTSCLCLLPLAFVYSRPGVDTACKKNIENIFKVHALKYRYEAVRFLYQESKNQQSYIYIMPKAHWNQYFELITGLPVDVEEQAPGVNSREVVNVERISEEEMNRYIKRLNCTPEKALKDYRDFIQEIKSDKEQYLPCIDTELAKGDLSAYAKDPIMPYDFLPPMQSVIPLPHLTKLDFLNVFKEFILDNDEELLPEGSRIVDYLRHAKH
jgi:hypothetical protein